jgi:hypothetical protein
MKGALKDSLKDTRYFERYSKAAKGKSNVKLVTGVSGKTEEKHFESGRAQKRPKANGKACVILLMAIPGSTGRNFKLVA